MTFVILILAREVISNSWAKEIVTFALLHYSCQSNREMFFRHLDLRELVTILIFLTLFVNFFDWVLIMIMSDAKDIDSISIDVVAFVFIEINSLDEIDEIVSSRDKMFVRIEFDDDDTNIWRDWSRTFLWIFLEVANSCSYCVFVSSISSSMRLWALFVSFLMIMTSFSEFEVSMSQKKIFAILVFSSFRFHSLRSLERRRWFQSTRNLKDVKSFMFFTKFVHLDLLCSFVVTLLSMLSSSEASLSLSSNCSFASRVATIAFIRFCTSFWTLRRTWEEAVSFSQSLLKCLDWAQLKHIIWVDWKNLVFCSFVVNW